MDEVPPVLDYETKRDERQGDDEKLPLPVRIVLGLIATPVTLFYGALFAASLIDGFMGIGWVHFFFILPFVFIPYCLWKPVGLRLFPRKRST